MTATFLPFISFAPTGLILFSLAQSATNLSSLPMETGSPFLPRIHCPSHWLSCGQTRPQIAGSALDSPITLYASSNHPSFTLEMNPGISIDTGHPCTHFAFLHPIHLFASSTASSALYPRQTSSKFFARTCGSCSLTGTLFNTSAIIRHLHSVHIRRDVYHLPVI